MTFGDTITQIQYLLYTFLHQPLIRRVGIFPNDSFLVAMHSYALSISVCPILLIWISLSLFLQTHFRSLDPFTPDRVLRTLNVYLFTHFIYFYIKKVYFFCLSLFRFLFFLFCIFIGLLSCVVCMLFRHCIFWFVRFLLLLLLSIKN